ncbi:MAG: phage tail protein [Methanocella sp.]|jgi:phage tail-like protein
MSTKVASQRNYPYVNNRFRVEIAGISQVNFLEVILPESASQVIEHREGSQNTTVSQKQPGLLSCSNLVLKWGLTSSMELYNWRKLVEQGKINQARRNVIVTLVDEEGIDVNKWVFTNAWPSKYKAPDLNALGNDVAIETLEIAFEVMQREK